MKEQKPKPKPKPKQTFRRFVIIRVVLDSIGTCLYTAICLLLIASVLAFLFLSGFLIWYITTTAIYLLGGGTIPITMENVAMVILLGLLGMWTFFQLVGFVVRVVKAYDENLRADYNQQIVKRLLEEEEEQKETENK